MPRIQERKLTRICTRLFADNLETLDELAKAAGEPRDLFLRTIVDAYCRHAKDRIRRKIDSMEASTR